MVDSESTDFAQVLPFFSIHYLLGFCGIHQDMADTMCKVYLYKRGCGIHHIQGIVCGVHHIQDMAYAMFKVYFYKRGCGIHHIQGVVCGVHHIQDMAYAMFDV